MKEQRRLDGLAAGRALSAELELNVTSAVALVVGGRNKPRDYLTFRPPFSRQVFDDRLTLLSELLTPSDFRSLISAAPPRQPRRFCSSKSKRVEVKNLLREQ